MPIGTWSVQVELTTSLTVTDDVADILTERLGTAAAVVTVEGSNRVAVRLTVEAATARAAFRMERVASGTLADLLPDAEVAAVHVVREQRRKALSFPD